MPKLDFINAALASRIDPDILVNWRRPCRPRILAVTDGDLNFTPSDSFGLWRFLQAITVAPGVTNKPVLTLAHRGSHPTPTVTVGADTYSVTSGFTFSAAATPVTLANYDQIWMWGIESGAFALSNADVGVLAEFMNSGGGVFATGDHAALGRAMCGSLPRIRHMREWHDVAGGGVPMGIESDATVAVNRIDTVVNPGANNVYEFDDQSDDIPQRIYPNYRVTDSDGAGGTQWSASVHPLLMLPGALATRSSTDAAGVNNEFTNDMDVLPDHPHESQCYEVTGAGVLGGTYNQSGQNFGEFQPSSADPAQRVGAQIVAYAVSGGRAISRAGYWKPPVRPRMFGAIAAYDGRLAQAYPGKTQRPGRIVCDSTWHHYINVNLDGTGSGRTGLGTGSGAAFTPSAQLEKIYAYYRNIVSWLQPANRVWCNIFWDIAAVRLNAAVYEELLEHDRLTGWRDWVGVGAEARKLLTAAYGSEHVREQVTGLLLSHEGTQALGDMLAANTFTGTALDADEMIDGVLGSLLVHMAQILPPQLDTERARAALEQGPAKHMKALQARLEKAAEQGVMHQVGRIERSLKLARRIELRVSR